jgi:hypothetical protein
MNPPQLLLIIISVIIIHFGVRHIVRRRIIDFLFSLSIVIISIIQLFFIGFLHRTYTIRFSTFPIFGDFSQPLVLLYDPLTSLNIFFLSLFYLSETYKNKINDIFQLLIIVLILLPAIIDVLSITIFIFISISVFCLEGLIDRFKLLSINSVILVLITMNILSWGHYNVSYVNYLYNVGKLPPRLYEIGLSMLLLIVVILISSLIGLVPISSQNVIDRRSSYIINPFISLLIRLYITYSIPAIH